MARRLWQGVMPGHGIILDVKHELGTCGRVAHSVHDLNTILNGKRNVVFQGKNIPETYAAVFAYVYSRGNTVLWIDEGAQVVPEGRTCSEAIQLFTAGRSRGAVAWTLTQRPAIISKTAISQSSHYFIFNLILSHDKKAICADIPLLPDDFYRLKRYEYFYYNQDMEAVKHCAPISEKTKK